MNEARILVERGAALLDEEVSGWDERINLRTLDVRNCQRCIGGQLFGTFAGLMAHLGLQDDPNQGRSYGLNWKPFRGPTSQELTKEWRDLIVSRTTQRLIDDALASPLYRVLG